MKKIDLLKVEYGRQKLIKDIVAEEQVLELYLNGEFIATLSCSPHFQQELVYGYLFLNGYIDSKEEIESLERMSVDSEVAYHISTRRILMKNSVRDTERKVFSIAPLKLLEKTLLMGEMFKYTGATHISGLSDGKSILSFFEDVSRMSTIYKLVGDALKRHMLERATVLVTSGRINGKIVECAARAGIKAVVSRGAVTDLAIKSAKESHITLIGFARNRGFNVYNLHDSVVLVG